MRKNRGEGRDMDGGRGWMKERVVQNQKARERENEKLNEKGEGQR